MQSCKAVRLCLRRNGLDLGRVVFSRVEPVVVPEAGRHNEPILLLRTSCGGGEAMQVPREVRGIRGLARGAQDAGAPAVQSPSLSCPATMA